MSVKAAIFSFIFSLSVLGASYLLARGGGGHGGGHHSGGHHKGGHHHHRHHHRHHHYDRHRGFFDGHYNHWGGFEGSPFINGNPLFNPVTPEFNPVINQAQPTIIQPVQTQPILVPVPTNSSGL